VVPDADTADRAKAGRRRRPENLRRRLLDTGARLFTAQGYQATAYDEIAEDAGVSQSVLFRHFGSKAELLVATVMEPFSEFLAEFTAQWDQLRQEQPVGEHPLRREFTTELFVRLQAHREPLRAMLTAMQSPTGDSLMRELGTRLGVMTAEIVRIGESHDRDLHRTQYEVDLTLRLVVGTVVTMTVLDDWFMPAGPNGPSDQQVCDVLATLILYGGQPAVRVTSPGLEFARVQPRRPAADVAEPGPRRSSGEVRAALVDSARRLFAEHGYVATSYRDIAVSASASESVLFRHFGRKSNLLEEAVLQPVMESYAAARATWENAAAPAPSSYLLVELYRRFRTDRHLYRTLIGLVSDPVHADLNAKVRSWLESVFADLAVLADPPDNPLPDSQIRVRIVAAMAMAAAALDDWFIPQVSTESLRDRLESAMERLAAVGRTSPAG
jgi:AcrR family transcriptional regulator